MDQLEKKSVIAPIKQRKVVAGKKPRKSFTRVCSKEGKDERAQVVEIMLMDHHKRMDEVAEKFGVTRQTIWSICKKNGIDPYRPIKRICEYCEGEFETTRALIRKGHGLYCNDKCYHNHRNEVGDYQPWRQGQRLARKAIEDWLGEPLPEGFIVHHEDGNHKNWDTSNLFVFPSQSEHIKYHHAKRDGGAELPYKELWELPGKIEGWLLSS